MKNEHEIHVHFHLGESFNALLKHLGDEQRKTLGKILNVVTLTQKNIKVMSQAVDDLKAKIQAQSDALDGVSTSVSGVSADVAFLKDKLSQLPDGASAAEIAELSSLVDGLGEKVTAIGTAASDLDASTDSTATV